VLPESLQELFSPFISLNLALLFSLRYIAFYAVAEQPGVAGVIAAALVGTGLLAAQRIASLNSFSTRVPALALAAHLACWVAQFYGHYAHEGRAPALLRNLRQVIITLLIAFLLSA